MIQSQNKVTSESLIEKKVGFNMQNSLITKDSFQNNNSQETTSNGHYLSIDQVLSNLEGEMMQIFRNQFLSFKRICHDKRIKEQKISQSRSEPSLQDSLSSISQKFEECKNSTIIKKEKSIWNIQQSESLKSHNNQSQHSQQSLVLSKTSHEMRKFKTKQTGFVQAEELQRMNSEDFQLSPLSRKFTRSNALITNSNNVSQTEIIVRDKNAVSIRLIDNYQSLQLESYHSISSNNLDYDRYMFAKKD